MQQGNKRGRKQWKRRFKILLLLMNEILLCFSFFLFVLSNNNKATLAFSFWTADYLLMKDSEIVAIYPDYIWRLLSEIKILTESRG